MKSAIRFACVVIVCLAVASTTRLVQSASANKEANNEDRNDRFSHDNRGNDDGSHNVVRVATGQYVTPTALRDSEQLFLNPGLAAYPNFIAGEAVRSQLSPDGTTLAILTAGHNSLVRPDGTTDSPNSTQYLFI